MPGDNLQSKPLIRIFAGMDAPELDRQISEELALHPHCDVSAVSITSHRDSLVAIVAFRIEEPAK